ncbi:hypothetical protein A2U01_0090254, partial [Trifolium medium]|nr:hypothetical protein [Trifolium medium]
NDTVPEVVPTNTGGESAVDDSLKATMPESNVEKDVSTSMKTSGKTAEQTPDDFDEASEYYKNDKEDIFAEKIVSSPSEENE